MVGKVYISFASSGLHASMAVSSLFVYNSDHTIIYLLLYVDDIIVTGNDSTQIHNLITALGQVFELKDLGPLTYFLGIQITRHLMVSP